MPAKKKKLRLRIEGKVVMSGFRHKVKLLAKAMGLKGWVKNVPGVLAVVVGAKEDLDIFLEGVRGMDNSLIQIDSLEYDFIKHRR